MGADMMQTEPATVAPVVDWSTFRAELDWRQGEHVSLVGPTGQGKSTLGLSLLDEREFVTLIATKPKDATLDALTRKRARPRWHRIADFDDCPPVITAQKILLWPKWERSEDTIKQQDVIARALDQIFAEGSWCVFVDELYYLTDFLGLSRMVRLIWQQGRSLGISLVGGTQRPAWVPLELYSQATHVFLFRHNDRRDLDRLGGIAAAGDVNPAVVRKLCSTLKRNQFLYVNTRNGQMLRSKVEL